MGIQLAFAPLAALAALVITGSTTTYESFWVDLPFATSSAVLLNGFPACPGAVPINRINSAFEGEENFVGDSEIIALGGASNETKDRPLG
ncbi:hypothetical protein MESMUL_19600 [Mesosutterella multiformis]|uniref:Uncharacterized protein n=1 Tax=Mesosutterella multiformis TaxID=2259133 RepID=A0A388SEA3_9BURK|nr:hypothetical protein MESMUL_19600 [Mesosutterella multiformis]